MRTREDQARREWVRSRILSEAWAAGFPRWPLFERIASWFAENRVSFGIFVSGPVGAQDDPIGLRVGFLTADSPRRILVVGWTRLNRHDLARLARDRRTVRVRVIGWLRISEDVDPRLAGRTLRELKVTGIARVPASIAAYLAA
jgi:hypothetical protein